MACAALLTGALTVSAAAQAPSPGPSVPQAAPTPPTPPESVPPTRAAGEDRDAGPSHALTGAAIVFNMIDANGDGSLDLTEVGSLTQAIFTTLDRDEDGLLSKDEINAALRHWRAPGAGPGFQPPRPRYQGPAQRPGEQQWPGAGGRNFAPRPDTPSFGNLDRNGDGLLSPEEFEALRRSPTPR
jgi:hypothetical protein